MPSFVPPSPLSAVDYEAIEAAVLETSRGRWFLAEYARRHRHADTGMLLTALERLENVVRDSLGGRREALAVSAGDLPVPCQVVVAPAVDPDMPGSNEQGKPETAPNLRRRDPLAPLAAMSYEEKIALFT